MRILAIVPHKTRVERASKGKLTLYSCEQDGFSWKMSDGTIGFGREPVGTIEEAEEVCEKINDGMRGGKRPEFDCHGPRLDDWTGKRKRNKKG